MTLTPDARALAGAIPGGGFGASARRGAGAGRQVQASGSSAGASSFSGLSGLSFNLGIGSF